MRWRAQGRQGRIPRGGRGVSVGSRRPADLPDRASQTSAACAPNRLAHQNAPRTRPRARLAPPAVHVLQSCWREHVRAHQCSTISLSSCLHPRPANSRRAEPGRTHGSCQAGVCRLTLSWLLTSHRAPRSPLKRSSVAHSSAPASMAQRSRLRPFASSASRRSAPGSRSLASSAKSLDVRFRISGPPSPRSVASMPGVASEPSESQGHNCLCQSSRGSGIRYSTARSAGTPAMPRQSSLRSSTRSHTGLVCPFQPPVNRTWFPRPSFAKPWRSSHHPFGKPQRMRPNSNVGPHWKHCPPSTLGRTARPDMLAA